SHLPQILSSVMASCLAKKDFSARPEYFPGVISNLLRISGSSFSMWQSILTTNQEPLRTALSELIQNLSEVNSHLPDKASPLFEESNSFYKEFKERKNKKEAI
ncbi:MAG TPA: prephenate dehydrogenase dimerization domain-containing protein, partial [Bdellovibrio sp.]|nr:prephenate dehydrogenase dimerization domain-containing protein [Bdellovibrio sp.]